MSDVVWLQDDMSWAGLRRVHALGGAEAARREALAMMEGEGGEPVMELAYEDEAGIKHFRMVWRLKMATYPMIAWTIDGDLTRAVGRAAMRYRERFGGWPNRAVVRSDPQTKPMMEAGAMVVEVVRLMDGEAMVVEVEVRPVGWMRRGDVAVYADDGSSDGQDD